MHALSRRMFYKNKLTWKRIRTWLISKVSSIKAFFKNSFRLRWPSHGVFFSFSEGIFCHSLSTYSLFQPFIFTCYRLSIIHHFTTSHKYNHHRLIFSFCSQCIISFVVSQYSLSKDILIIMIRHKIQFVRLTPWRIWVFFVLVSVGELIDVYS